MNKRLAVLSVALTLVFMLGALVVTRYLTATGTPEGSYLASGSAENTICRIEGNVVQININAADAQTLTLLDGVGEKLAERIVAYREEHGVFSSVEDLLNVEGLGEGKLSAIRDEIYCGKAE